MLCCMTLMNLMVIKHKLGLFIIYNLHIKLYGRRGIDEDERSQAEVVLTLTELNWSNLQIILHGPSCLLENFLTPRGMNSKSYSVLPTLHEYLLLKGSGL